MAVLMAVTIPGADRELYEKVNRELGFPDDIPPGLLSHHAAATEESMLIFDVWESKEHFEDFAAERLAPAMEKVTGGTGQGLKPTFAELVDEFHRD